ncbi:hypothetical protein SAY86_004252 [Trapa natans]|uniref:RRM domain-containing protein n=1 Tax=Trapa natans TaxID=22666 RepID=A0AAN7ME52_TRANT|nr:hypothetical protein SAY86_004252 [Trapa natans]
MEYQPIPSPSSGSQPFQFLNSPFGDTTYTKVFVGGLAWETHSDTLRQHFEQYGDILEAVVISDKHTGRSKGYGFVTFRDPDAARRACADPAPIIDGRRANCNLASLGRARPPMPFVGRPRQSLQHLGSMPGLSGAYVGNVGYQQPFPYGYQQGYVYPPYGQGLYSPYMGQQQYLQVYGVPGTGGSAMYPYGQLSQTVPGCQSYTAMQGYAVPGHQVVQLTGPGMNTITSPSTPTSQASYPTGKVSRFGIHGSSCSINFLPDMCCLRFKLALVLFATLGAAVTVPNQQLRHSAPAQFMPGGGSDHRTG